ncbi:hypothetical protein [Arcobacter porcinus]|uniref:hypothetical protein n=1 Tax=Arcobacter porcinus TaxID=1935204 RepID=UPI00081E36E8|nr:hypothetical protein [Arcobacter porcinus]OCL81893.1 hypothetical protein AAW29_01601 [Arcobacter porcinus]
MSIEIKIQLNNFDYIVISDCFTNGIDFKMYSKSKDGIIKEFNDGKSSNMKISHNNLNHFIVALQKIQHLINIDKGN